MEKTGYDIKIAARSWTSVFYSAGPKGSIKKVNQFTPYNIDGNTFFNLCFGDWNSERKLVDDTIITNNNDSSKVLVTVARSVISFTDMYPDALVFVKGSTSSRTRLFQMGITKHWIKTGALFTLFGFTNNKWQHFLKNVNYDAFMVLRKPDPKRLIKVTVSNEVKDYSNDPTIIKRAQEANEFLAKVGFPKEFVKMRDAKRDESNEVVDYSKDPTFIKRAQEAKELLEKVGFPQELLKIRDAQYGKK
jgi:hypothetical protein